MRKMRETETDEGGKLKSRDPRGQGRRDGFKSFNRRGDDRHSLRNPDYNAKFNFSYSFSSSESENENDSDDDGGIYLRKHNEETEKENQNKVRSK